MELQFETGSCVQIQPPEPSTDFNPKIQPRGSRAQKAPGWLFGSIFDERRSKISRTTLLFAVQGSPSSPRTSRWSKRPLMHEGSDRHECFGRIGSFCDAAPLCKGRRGGTEVDASGTSFQTGSTRTCTLSLSKVLLRISQKASASSSTLSRGEMCRLSFLDVSIPRLLVQRGQLERRSELEGGLKGKERDRWTDAEDRVAAPRTKSRS
jgi:hypothetical protein